MKKAEFVSIGRVLRSQGNQGQIKIRLREEPLPQFSPFRVYLERGGTLEAFDVEAFERDRNSHFLKLSGIDTLARANELVGCEIYVSEESLPRLEDGGFYQFQVFGSKVVRKDGTFVGTVKGILPAGGNTLLLVAGVERDLYIPFTESICVRVDPDRKEIEIDPPDGLLELNEI